MIPPKNCIATKVVALLALLLASQAAVAESAGVVSDSTGPLLAKTASGSIKVLVAGSSVEPLDTLISRPGVYARVTLTDHSDLALGPDTELAIESYSFHDKGMAANTAVLRLSKGSVRVSTGTLGARDTDSFTLAAGQTTIAIHHSVFIATYLQATHSQLSQRDNASASADRAHVFAASNPSSTDARSTVQAPSSTNARSAVHVPSALDATLLAAMTRPVTGHMYLRVASVLANPTQPLELSDSPIRLAQSPPAPGGGTLPPGLYVQVIDGLINVANPAGSQSFTAGQFGFTPSIKQPPIILPANPSIQFTPPPSFSTPASPTPGSSGSKPADVDCVVR